MGDGVGAVSISEGNDKNCFLTHSGKYRRHRGVLLGHGCSVHPKIFPSEFCLHRN